MFNGRVFHLQYYWSVFQKSESDLITDVHAKHSCKWGPTLSDIIKAHLEHIFVGRDGGDIEVM